jgi:glutamate/tyrosine decarboxylase-like PLP-dependent enzyme
MQSMSKVSPISQGRSWESIRADMLSAHETDKRVHHERSFRVAYYVGDVVLKVGKEAFAMYYEENALYGGTQYLSVKRYEDEIIEFLLHLMQAPDGATGKLTIGGTESNMMAVKMARDWAADTRPVAGTPELILPRTAHPSFFKAAQMLGLKPIRMARSVDFQADVEAMTEAVTDNTVAIIASAPPYAYGVTDPVKAIAEIAESNNLWLHVDCCMGGLFLPFARQVDSTIPAFDFSISGIRSLSADLHKYGYAPKGISSLMLRDADLAQYRDFVASDPVGGYYATPNIAGTRPAGTIAAAWAVVNYLGYEGYLESVRELLRIKGRILAGISEISDLEVCGTPHAVHFNVFSPTLDIMAISTGLEERGWATSLGGEPNSIWMMLNYSHRDIVDEFLSGLCEVVDLVKRGEIVTDGRGAVYAK